MSNKIITINRQYGSGGRDIGKRLAEKLGVEFYDKELISLAAKESGFAETVFENADERPTNSLLYSIVSGQYSPRAWYYGTADVLTNDTLFSFQADIIRKVSAAPCVIVGRCADFILRDNPNLVTIYTHAPFEHRVKYAMSDNPKQDEKAATNFVKKMDKTRSNYYYYYASRQWDLASNYDLTLRTDVISTDEAVEIIMDYLSRRAK